MILIFWSILQSILHVYYFFWGGKGVIISKRTYSLQPPTTPILPAMPLCVSYVKGGITDLTISNNNPGLW